MVTGVRILLGALGTRGTANGRLATITLLGRVPCK